MAKKKKRMTKKKKFKLLLIVELILLILVIAGAILATVAKNYMNKIKKDDNFKEEEISSDNSNSEVIDNYTNIAVFGVDSRKNDLKKALSDMIMVVSINNETKDVKVVSVYRDSLLYFGEDGDMGFAKATHAYSKGGGTMAVKMLNENFDLNITDYVTVNFDAVASAVDAIGGVDIDISSKEQKDINRYIEEINKVNGTKSPYIYDTGVLHLDGTQATAYGRLREIDSDYARTERQREVMMELFNSVKGASAGKLKKLVDTMIPKVLTTLDNGEILDMALDVASYNILDTTGFPFEFKGGSHPRYPKKGWVVMPDNLTLSVKQLHEYLFDDENYEPSETVKEISAKLDDELGREENTKTTMYDTTTTTSGDDASEGTTTKAGAQTKSTKKSGE